MGVRVGAAHGGTLVLEDLEVGILFLRQLHTGRRRGIVRVAGGQVRLVERGPGGDDGEDCWGGEVSEGEVVGGVEGDDVAAAFDALCLEEEG